MGRRNRQHTVKISKMENGILKHEEVICGSLAEAYDIANEPVSMIDEERIGF